MPLLTYTYAQFVTLTKIQSGVLNQYFTDIKTLLNTTKLDNTNIQPGGIATANLADNSVTQAKRVALGQQVSTSSSTFTTANTTVTAVTNLSVTITTTGRPVFIGLISDGDTTPGNTSYIGISASATTSATGTILITDGSVNTLSSYSLVTGGASGTLSLRVPSSSVHTIDIPAAGSQTYKIYAMVTGTATIAITRCKLIAYEL